MFRTDRYSTECLQNVILETVSLTVEMRVVSSVYEICSLHTVFVVSRIVCKLQ
jgi:hypothetical protein